MTISPGSGKDSRPSSAKSSRPDSPKSNWSDSLKRPDSARSRPSSAKSNSSANSGNDTKSTRPVRNDPGCVEGNTFYLFQSNTSDLSGIQSIQAFDSVTCVVIIGQPLKSLSGVEHLHSINELWVVECRIRSFHDIANCRNLKKLYLYSNEIVSIPCLKDHPNLHVLWLSNNNITTIESPNIPKCLQELYIANNGISTIPDTCFASTKLKSLNVSGNPIENFKVLNGLKSLSSLQSLVFSDSMYKTCPVCYCTNYRSYIIYALPQLTCLDNHIINSEEKKLTNEYYLDTLFYYRVLKDKLVADHYNEIMEINMEEQSKLQSVRRAIIELVKRQRKYSSKKSDEKKKSFSDVLFKKSYFKYKAIRIVGKTAVSINHADVRLQSELDKMNFEIKNVGKYIFKNYSRSTVLGAICQNLLNEYTCCFMKKNLYIQSVELVNVTHIYNSESPVYYGFDLSSFYILASPVGITDLSDWSFSFLHDYLSETLDESIKMLTLTDCIVSADNSVLDIDKSKSLSNPRVAIIIRKRDITSILTLSQKACHGAGHNHSKMEKSSKICGKFLGTAYELIPLFIVEFCYVKDNRKSNNFTDDDDDVQGEEPRENPFIRAKNKANKKSRIGSNDNNINGSNSVDESKNKFTLEATLQTPNWKSLTDINVSCADISSFGLGKVTKMPNIYNLDMSYNNFTSLEEVQLIFPNIQTINASFNNIGSLSLNRVLKRLAMLDLSWNHISRLVVLLLQLKTNAPALHDLNLQYNPIGDVHNNVHIDFFINKYLPDLVVYNGQNIKKEDNTFLRPVCKMSYDKMQCGLCCSNHENPLTLDWMSYMCMASNKTLGSEPHLGFGSTGRLECISAGGQPYFHNELNEKKNFESVMYVDLSRNGLDKIPAFKYMCNLVQLNLSDNLIRTICTNANNFICLTRLNLSRNYLTSLKDLSNINLPSLKLLDVSCNRISSLRGLQNCCNLEELYAAHNGLFSLESIMPVKKLHKLRAISLNYNLVVENHHYRLFLIYHLTHLEVHLDGKCLVNVKVLDLEYNSITCLKGMASLPSLKVLNLGWNRVSTFDVIPKSASVSSTEKHEGAKTAVEMSGDGKVLKKNSKHSFYPNLEVLSLHSNRITSLLPLQLQSFPKLNTLMLQDNEITSLQGLIGMKKLRCLVLDKNKISNISAEDFEDVATVISELYLESNSLRSLKFLKKCSKLKRLFLAQNRIQEPQELKNLDNLGLQETTLWGNAISRLSNYHTLVLESTPDLFRFDGVFLQQYEPEKPKKKKEILTELDKELVTYKDHTESNSQISNE
ncbi:uncharacterized protein LOC142326424 isoform X2 [Lycorma delicatula]|uniref:uncharacterized protein LOC142326424 isoform X2 n=1 Tax=Lycorma delicatula TaxID=130591 RepID=UPI003F5140EC